MSIFRVINLRMDELISLNNSGESSGKSKAHRINVFFSMNRVNRFLRKSSRDIVPGNALLSVMTRSKKNPA